MKKLLKLLLLLTLALVFALSVALLAACNEEEDPYEYVEGKGNTVKVILDSISDPTIKDSIEKVSYGVIDYRVKPDSLIPEPGVTSNTSAPKAEGFIFEGFYEGSIDVDGNVIWGNKWDFSRKVTQDLTLYGKWLIQYKIHINYVIDGVLQQNGEDVNIIDNAESVTSIKQPSWSGNTFVQMYEDAECKTVLTVSNDEPFVHGCTQENPVREVYAEFIQGSWTLVRSASDMRTFYAGTNLYLMDDVDINDLKDDKGNVSISIPADYNGTIEGNNHTISNLNFERASSETGTVKSADYRLGLFSRLNSATIRNLKFKDCTVSGVVRKLNTEYFYGFLAGQARDDCVLDNISFENCTLKRLTFKIAGGISAEQEAAQRENVTQNALVGELLSTCKVTNVVTDGLTQEQEDVTENAQVAMLPTTKKY